MDFKLFVFLGISFFPKTCFGLFDNLYQRNFPERCTEFWIHNNVTGLRSVLQLKLYGQHLALKAVVNHIYGHTRNEKPLRSLALSFHGSSGTGKNYVSQMIAEHLYKEGMKSKFVHLISSRDFHHITNQHLADDKARLRSWIEGNVTLCPQPLFIFDEVDKMPAGLLDTLKPYLAFYDNLGGVSYRKVIFIFLSNSGGNFITKFTVQHWRNGLPRDKIQITDLEKKIAVSAVNSDAERGLWHSELITKYMMSSLIMFLPLERVHVRKCIKHSLMSNMQHYDNVKEFPEVLIEEVMNQLPFYPQDGQMFATSGCKQVEQKVHLVMDMN